MGCICSKGVGGHEFVQKESKKTSKRFIATSRRDELIVEVDSGAHDATTRLISEVIEENVVPVQWEDDRVKKTTTELPVENRNGVAVNGAQQPGISRVFTVRNGVDGAQVSAGWPSWLAAVAGEAIKGWLPRKADSFEKLDKIGQGTYSSVYKALDLETRKIVALKKVRFVNMDPESVRFMAREIIVLRTLDHPNVMKLEGLVTSRASGNLYLVFEYMEHDLTGLATSPNVKFTEPQIKCYMQQLLRGLEHCHSRGVLHRDIKGSNLLIDDNGNLKIGDFGLATFFRGSQRQLLTSRVVTLWYRPPELLLGATDYGVAVDLWSSGCILAELLAGKPIMPGRTEVEQLHKIFKLCGSPSEEYWRNSKLPHATIFKPQQPYKRCLADTFNNFPPSALVLLDSLLAFEPEKRGSATSALQSEFFTSNPLPCDPSSLPKYPPSKEFNAKQRDEEKRRQKSAISKGSGIDTSKSGTGNSKVRPVIEESHKSIEKQEDLPNMKSGIKKYNLEDGSGFAIEPSRESLQNGAYHGRLVQPVASFNLNANKGGALMSPYKYQSAHLSQFSNSVHGSSRYNFGREQSPRPKWLEERQNKRYIHLNDDESSHQMLDRPDSSYKKHGVPAKEPTLGYAPKKNRIHYSGPLLPNGGNIEEMLKEHERQIQNAVRKARIDRAKGKNSCAGNGQAESLIQIGGGHYR